MRRVQGEHKQSTWRTQVENMENTRRVQGGLRHRIEQVINAYMQKLSIDPLPQHDQGLQNNAYYLRPYRKD